MAAYAAINGIAAFGLRRARRWAEFVTLIEVAVLLPVEIHELAVRVSVLKATPWLPAACGNRATTAPDERHKLTPDRAFQLLAQASMKTNAELSEVADHLVRTGELRLR